MVLQSEGAMTDQINRARGEAEAIRNVAEATAQSIEMIAAAIRNDGGSEAVALQIAEQYVAAFSDLAKESTTMLLPANANDAGVMVAQALGVFETVRQQQAQNTISGLKGPWQKDE
jgi:regulator of protease activity HflC (stomatin/prohibitin superfamily)